MHSFEAGSMISISCYTPSWNRKEDFASNQQFPIDEIYAEARNHGAIGGKITGASGGGHLILIAYLTKSTSLRIGSGKWMWFPAEFAFERNGIQTWRVHEASSGC